MLAAVLYLAFGRLQTWVEAQDRYLGLDEVASLQVSTPSPTATLAPSATPEPSASQIGRAHV